MSSSVHITLKDAILLSQWEEFCRREGLVHHPNVVGGNVYYGAGPSEVEVYFGRGNHDQKLPFRPPAKATEITVSTFWMGRRLEHVADVAAKILRAWPGTYYPSPELTDAMEGQGAFELTRSCQECSEEHRQDECPNR